MAAKVIFLLALTAAVVCAENDCNCDPETEMETKELWNFLTKLSSDRADPEDKEMRAVLPGVLSPLLECNCLEQNRKKRMILSEAHEAFGKLESLQSEERKEHRRLKKSIQFKTLRCPQGHAWIGIMCVPEEYLD